MSAVTDDTLFILHQQEAAAHETFEAREAYAAEARSVLWPHITKARQERERATVFITLVQLVEAQAAAYGITGITIPAADLFRQLGAEDRARRAAARAVTR